MKIRLSAFPLLVTGLLFCAGQPASAAETRQTSAPSASPMTDNQKTAIAFWNTINEQGWDAGAKYLGPNYHEHSGGNPSGLAALRDYYDTLHRTQPGHYSAIVRSVAEGDLVFLQVHDFKAPGDFGTAIMCYLRFENGKIAEQWTAKQAVPGIRNFNGMF